MGTAKHSPRPSGQHGAADALVHLRNLGFEVQFLSHAQSILQGEFADALKELEGALESIRLPVSEIIGSGGGETKFTQRLRHALSDLGWQKHLFVIAKSIDGVARESTSHEVDHVKRFPAGVLACEIEWNNKDPFFDRDLENFKRLHAEGAISVGVLITRGKSLQDALLSFVLRFASERGVDGFEALGGQGVSPTPKQRANILRRVQRDDSPLPFAQAWAENFVSNKFGQATTHWSKLQARVSRGVGNPCPLLLIGLPSSIVDFDDAKVEPLNDDDLAAEGAQTSSGN